MKARVACEQLVGRVKGETRSVVLIGAADSRLHCAIGNTAGIRNRHLTHIMLRAVVA